MTQEPSSSIPPAGQTDYIYYAFVSYSHKDGKWAKWIQNALERYRLPAAVRREAEKPLPIRIHPVFRDSTDLGVGKLAETLRKELDQSKYLIVVCSPNSALPNEEGKHWVNEEVARFCELGHADRIIPVIVGGTKDTAYCPKLLEEDILGLDATKHPKPRILNDLVAKILGLRPDELWRREERRLRARRRWRAFGASFIAAFLALGVYAALDSTRTVTRAFADYVDSYGLPEGRGPLTSDQLVRRHAHYRFEFRGYRCEWFGKSIHADSASPSLLRALGFRRVLQRVVHSDPYGNPVGHEDFLFAHRPPVQYFEFDLSGCLTRTDAMKTDSTPLYGVRWKFGTSQRGSMPSSALAIFEYDEDVPGQGPPSLFGEIGQHHDAIKEQDKLAWHIAEWNLSFGPLGRVEQITFQNAFHRAVPDRLGITTIDVSREDNQTTWWFPADNVPEGKGMGGEQEAIHGIRRETLPTSVVRTTFLDKAGDAKWHAGRWWTFREQTLVDGNIVAVRYDTPEEIRGSNIGFPRLEDADDAAYAFVAPWYYRLAVGHKSEFNGHGSETNRIFIDRHGKPVTTEAGYAGFRDGVDSRGWTTNRLFIGTNLLACAVENGGYCGWEQQYDDEHRTTNFCYLDHDGKPYLHRKALYAGYEAQYDGNGNIALKRYFGTNRLPCILPSGYAGWQAGYDSHGNMTNIAFLGTNNRPLIQPEGFAAKEMQFDAFGNPTNVVYLGEDLKPLLQAKGFARIATGFDPSLPKSVNPFENLFKKKSSQNDAQFFLQSENADLKGNKFYLSGKATNRVYYGTDGRLALVDDGEIGDDAGPIAGWWKHFGPQGEVVEVGTIGTNGLPMVNNLGWAICRIKGSEEKWFDPDGNPIMQTGIESRTNYDSPNIKTTWYFDRRTGRPAPNEISGAFGMRECRDNNGNITYRLFLNADGLPQTNKQGYASVSYERSTTDEGGRKIVTQWKGSDGKPIVPLVYPNCAARVEMIDRRGHQTACIDYDAQGSLIERLPEEGAAYAISEFLDRPGTMNETKKTFIGTNGLPVTGKKSGYATITFDYNYNDDNSRVITYHYFGTDGRPIAGPGGHWMIRFWEDPYENITNQAYYTQNEKLFVHPDLGYASRSKKYDYSWGTRDNELKQTNESYFDADGNLVAKKTGEAGWEDKFDDRGRQIERTYFGTNGKPVMTKYGFAVRKMFYDDSGVETNRLLLDADGKPVPSKKEKGSTKKKMVYSWKPHHDESGLLVLETYEAEDGTLGQDSLWSKTSSILYRYDEHGRETNRLYRGLQGQPVIRGRFPMETGARSATAGRNWMGESGYSELRCRYTPDGLLAEKSFWGTNGAPLESSSGSHVIRYAYDATGAVTEERHFSTNGTPCVNQSGYHAKRISRNANGQAKVDYLDVDGCTELCEWQVGTVESADLQVFSPMPDIQPNDILVKKRYAHVFPLDEIIWYSLIEREEIFSLEEKWIDQMGIAAWLSVSMFARKGENGYDIHVFRQEVDSRRQRFGPPVLLLGVTANKKNTRLPVNDGEVFLQSLKEWLKDLNEDNIVDIRKSE